MIPPFTPPNVPEPDPRTRALAAEADADIEPDPDSDEYPQEPEDSAEEDVPDFRLRPTPLGGGMRFRPRLRILFFAIVAGGLSSTILAFVLTSLTMIFAQQNLGMLRGSELSFMSTFVYMFGLCAPWLVMVAAVAAAAEVISRRLGRAAEQNTQALMEAIRRARRDNEREQK